MTFAEDSCYWNSFGQQAKIILKHKWSKGSSYKDLHEHHRIYAVVKKKKAQNGGIIYTSKETASVCITGIVRQYF